MKTTATQSAEVPLAVWPVSQTSAQYQRTGRYLTDSFQHPGKMVPELARRIVETYSKPWDLVVDPMCGTGTTLIEGAELGRRCVGVELEPRWVELTKANLDHVLPFSIRGLGEVKQGDARELWNVLGHVGTVDLIVTSPPYACTVGTVDKSAWRAGRSLCDPDTLNYSSSTANLGHARQEDYLVEMAKVYEGCHRLLKPGGLLVTVTKNMRHKGSCLDLAAATVKLATDAGFSYVQHVVALLCAIRGDELVARPSFWQLSQTRRARERGYPSHLVAHEDVLVFKAPGSSSSSGGRS